MEDNLKGKVAFITGAAHGQGRATALALAEKGVHIAALDISRPLDDPPQYEMGTLDDLDTLQMACETLGVQCIKIIADVRNDKELETGVNQTLAQFKKIDILFNNAGICGFGYTHELTEQMWDQMLDINLKGAWLAGRRIIPVMKEQGSGVIINNSSIGGLRGMGRLAHYAASKWGLTGLTKSWAIELAPYNIRVVSIHPTGVNTPMNDGLAKLEGKTTHEIAEASAGNLINVPWIEPEDVAEAVVYLASDKARYITGSEFVIDAGLLTR